MTDSDDLIEFVSAVSGDAYLKVEENLGDGYVRLRVSEAERRQAKHDIRSFEDVVIELLRNARDAHAQRVFIATGREGDTRMLTILDDGVGMPPGMHERVFEPRVTTKLDTMVMDRWGVHGRGMALFSVRSNVTEARVAASDLHKGSAVTIHSATHALSERSDQSQWPVVERGDDGIPRVVRGPHNIIRRAVEFACEHPEVDVHLGSAAEILATLYALARKSLDVSDLLFCDDCTRLPVWQRPAAAADATELTEVAASIGLGVSERTAHRVLAGELPALETVARLVCADETPPAPAPPDIYRDRRGLKLAHTDLALFRQELERAFDTIAERYYLHLRNAPRVTVGRDEIRVRFEVEKDD
ncbi:MAG: ATP-binding protein [Coriobacteriaceae bacterium]|nr:ATP-binding protein [Coriobacteriaceae bacterium]